MRAGAAKCKTGKELEQAGDRRQPPHDGDQIEPDKHEPTDRRRWVYVARHRVRLN